MVAVIPAKFYIAGILAIVLIILAVKVVGRGHVEVLAPLDGLTAQVDADTPIVMQPGAHKTVSIPKGKHSLALRAKKGTSTHTFDIEGGLDWFLVSGPEQCLVLVDISHSHYAIEGQAPVAKPSITAIMSAGTKMVGKGNLFYPDQEPPPVANTRADITMVREIPCALETAPSDEILRFLQF